MDNQPRCFVPDCNKDVGVLFPKNPIVKKKWLKSLGLAHLNSNIDSKSFVCLDHFEDDGQPGAVPKTTTSPVPTSTDVLDKSSSVGSNVLSRRTSPRSGLLQKINNVVVIQALKREMMAKTRARSKPVMNEVAEDPTNIESLNKEEELSHDSEVHENYNTMCRLCMGRFSEPMEYIYDKVNGKYTIAHMIIVCLHPMQVSPTDKLSKNICTPCLRTLKEYFKFYHFCLGMDAKQRELIAIDLEYPSDGHYADSENSEEYLHEERLSDYEDNKKNTNESRSEKTNGHLFNRYSTDQERESPDKNSKNKSDIDVKFDKVEEELAKVLEGGKKSDLIESKNTSQSEGSNLYESEVADRSFIDSRKDLDTTATSSKTFSVQVKGKDDEIYTENIIIEMVDDEELQATPPMKLPITIKRISSDTPKTPPVKKKRTGSNSFINASQDVTVIKSDGNEGIVVLPKGIKVAVKEKYCSPLGVYPCKAIKYLFNTEFLLADGYLYEYWLAKNNVRNLHCIVSRCPCSATQSRLDHTTFSDEIEVVKAHDHEPPDAMERKRQMFYNIMYCKMRKDRNFNFKLLYEQFCKLDPDLWEILPLRKVISEICKQGPAVQPPAMDCFDQFYDAIESDAFHKIHFTENHIQFYQDRFETEEGGKAVVFANSQVVELYSYSKIMYVDASFHIESSDFPYKLVTVLVWVYESFYPILYAFVNRKSQEIYRQIFSFLHSTLAPNLRPEEIITDYEANLYYALGETYAHCTIGGSIFYFAQNLYKKICALKLSRELDVNSNFRSVYNMLIMLPLLPVNTILAALNNIEVQAKELGLEDLTNELFLHVHNEWICNVSPDFFCVHRLESRINENIVAPFKKLRDLIMLSRSKSSKPLTVSSYVVHVIERIIDLEKFLRDMYNGPGKKTFAKDLSSSQKKIVLKAWNFIENHPKININHFFLKVLGYIKCLENQLWIWGFYRYEGDTNDELINANDFSRFHRVTRELQDHEYHEDKPMDELTDEDNVEGEEQYEEQEEEEDVIEEFYVEDGGAIRRVGEKTNALEEFSETQETETTSEKEQPAVLMEAVIDENGSFVLQNTTNTTSAKPVDNDFFVYK